MFHLCDVFEFVVHGISNGSLSQQHLVRDTHHGTLHVALQLCDEQYAINEKLMEEVLADVSFVCNEFVEDLLDETFVLQRLPVINIPRCHHEVQKFALLIADKVQLEIEEPSH